MVASLRDIPNYISASSPKGLRRKMLKNNFDKKKVHRYFDIQMINEESWVAWYYENMSMDDELKEIEDANGSEPIR